MFKNQLLKFVTLNNDSIKSYFYRMDIMSLAPVCESMVWNDGR